MNETREGGHENQDFSELRGRYNRLMDQYLELIKKVLALAEVKHRPVNTIPVSRFEDVVNNLRGGVVSWLDIENDDLGSVPYDQVNSDLVALEKYLGAIAEHPQFLLDEASKQGAFPDLHQAAREASRQPGNPGTIQTYANLAVARLEQQSSHEQS